MLKKKLYTKYDFSNLLQEINFTTLYITGCFLSLSARQLNVHVVCIFNTMDLIAKSASRVFLLAYYTLIQPE